MFHTISEDNTIEGSHLKFDSAKFSAEPTVVILTPPTKTEDNILLTSNWDEPSNFCVESDEPAYLHLFPKRGIILPNQTLFIRVILSDTVPIDKRNASITVRINHDVFNIKVKVIPHTT